MTALFYGSWLRYEGELAPVVRGNGYFDAIVSVSDLLGIRGT